MPKIKSAKLKDPAEDIKSGPSRFKSQVHKNDGEDRQVEIPNLVRDHDKVRAEIASKTSYHKSPKNPLNAADAHVKSVRGGSKEWSINKPYKLESHISGNAPYRGQGLLPEDQTKGADVIGGI